MLNITQLIGFGDGGGLQTLRETLDNAGLRSNTNLCLDAGDAASYTSGQSWLDRSGNGYDFFLGVDGAATATDPTFTGTAGVLTNATYFALDGGDVFKYDTTNETFMNNWHKDSALFTFIALVYLPSGTVTGGIIGDITTGTDNGVWLTLTSGVPVFTVGRQAAGDALVVTADSALATGWHMLALSIDEAGASGFFYADGAYNQVSASNTFNATYTSPDAGASTNTYGIGADSSTPSGSLPNGSRLMGFAALDKACSKAELDTIWGIVRQRLAV